jgi:hypothetical protein
MPIRSLSFDDPSDDDLVVFSGHDLMLSRYDHMDLDWQEVAERTAIDERRGLKPGGIPPQALPPDTRSPD